MKFGIVILFGSVALAAHDLSLVNDLDPNDRINTPTEISSEELLKQIPDNLKIEKSSNDQPDSNMQKNALNLDEAEPKVQPVGLNNIDNDEQGNWILKKLWWQEGQNVYNDILKINDELLTLQLSFLVIKNDMEKQFLIQWQSLNIDEANLTPKFNDFKSDIAKAREKKIESDENELQRTTRLDNAAKALDGLKKDFQDIFNNQNQADEGFKQVTNNLKKCRNFETDSWSILQQIAKTLDDQKARGYYQKMFTNYQNTKNLALFLKDEYFSYMKKLAEEQKLIFASIKDRLQVLANSGYRFDKAALNSVEVKESLANKTFEDEKIERQKKQQAKIAKANANKSFIDKVYAKLNSWFSKIF